MALWGVYDTVQKTWWPRSFPSKEEARAHYERCKGPGSRGEPRLIESSQSTDPIEALADRIVADLFRNGHGEDADLADPYAKVERLVLTSKDGRELGGWCRGAVRDVILRELRK